MATITISDNTGATYSGVADNFLREANPDNNQGSNSVLEIQTFVAGDRKHSIIRFDGLSNVSTGGTVSNAKIRLYQEDLNNALELSVYRLIQSWVENNSSWDYYNNPLAWQTPGATGALDRDSSASATFTPSASGLYIEFTGTGINSLVQGWIDSSFANNGVYIACTNDTAYNFNYNRYTSSQGSDGFRPELVFDYDAGGVTLALTGQSITSGQGNLSDLVSTGLTGQSSTVGQGALTDVVSKQLTGQSATVIQGTLSDAVSKQLTGQPISMGQGNITPMGDITYALSGQSIAVSQGQLTDNVSKGITGQLIQSNQGTLTDSVLVALDGQQITSQQGNVLFQGDVTRALTGQAVAVQQGSLTLPQESLFGGVAHFSNLDEYNKKKSAKRVEAQQKKLSEKQTAKIQAKKVSDGIVQDTPMQYLESIDDLLIAQNEVIEQNPIVNNQTDLIRDYLIIAQNKKQEEETIAFMIMVLLSN